MPKLVVTLKVSSEKAQYDLKFSFILLPEQILNLKHGKAIKAR